MTLSTKFADMGTAVSVISFDSDTIKDELKPAVYSVGFNPMSGYYLNKVGDKMNTPEKVYGAVDRRVNKIMTSYNNTGSSFGVLMSGHKGSGKTMTGALVANKAIEELDIPVVLVEDSFDPSSLASFIQKLGEVVLFFDEFGKRFNDAQGEQGGLLSLMDGTGSTKRLVILTENERSDINRYMLNRPGRMHYHFEYGKLEEETVSEFCEEQGVDKATVDKIQMRREKVHEFSFDVLQALVSEWKLYGGDIDELAEDLNIERSYKDVTPQMVCLEVLDVNTGSELNFVDKARVFPNAKFGSYVALKDEPSEDKTVSLLDEDEDDDDMFELNRELVRVDIKSLVKKEGDIYTFSTTRDNGDKLLIRVLKDVGGTSGYMV